MKATAKHTESVYTLELSEFEASVLAELCQNVSGSPHCAVRTVTDTIDTELRSVGLKETHREYFKCGSGMAAEEHVEDE